MANIKGWGADISASLCETDDKERIMDFLHAADMDIDDILVEEKSLDSIIFPDDLPEEVKTKLRSVFKERKLVEIKTVHKSSDGQPVTFDLAEESDGTQKLFSSEPDGNRQSVSQTQGKTGQ
jgi:hypothetical protein